jgi:small subunit ribosomal protein S19
MTRSVWKPPFVDGFLLKKVQEAVDKNIRKPIKTMSRRSTIIPNFVGMDFEVYDGKKYVPVRVVEEMVGHKFGEFAPTRRFSGHAGDKKAKAG